MSDHPSGLDYPCTMGGGGIKKPNWREKEEKNISIKTLDNLSLCVFLELKTQKLSKTIRNIKMNLALVG